MIGRNNRALYEYAMVDLNTQQDFCTPDGADPVLNLVDLIPSLRRVVAWTKRNCVPVVSAIDSQRPCEAGENGPHAHCVDGSDGQRKVDFTVLPQFTRVEVDNTLSVPLDLFDRFQQLIFRERTADLFSNPKADRLLTQMSVGTFVVFGNVLEGSVRAMALGLLSRAKSVMVVHDACGYRNRVAADLALRLVTARGGNIVSVDELLARRLMRHRRCRLSLIRGWSSNGQTPDGKKRVNGRSGNGRQTRPTLRAPGAAPIKDAGEHG